MSNSDVLLLDPLAMLLSIKNKRNGIEDVIGNDCISVVIIEPISSVSRA